MDVRYTRDEAGLATLTITVDAEQIDQIYTRALKDLRRHINAPGFRPGRVPPKMVETIVGREQIAEYAQDLLKEQVYPDALAEVPTLVTLDEPELDLESFERGSEATLIAKVRTAQVTLGEYSGLPIERWRATVTDEEALEQLQA